ncbi:VOC family protein, partial [Candidatus Cyanaurora vandensis]
MGVPDILGIDHLTFYVPEVDPWALWFRRKLNCQSLARSEQWTILQTGGVVVVLKVPQDDYLTRHPPGLGDICFLVRDLTPVRSLAQVWPVGEHSLRMPAIGDVTHTFRQGRGFSGQSGGFRGIDHVVFNVAAGQLERVRQWYEDTLGWSVQAHYTIQGTASALQSYVMVNPTGTVQIPINQPASPNSQVQEFLDHNRGAGVQHVALISENIFRDVARLRSRGVSFLKTPTNSS